MKLNLNLNYSDDLPILQVSLKHNVTVNSYWHEQHSTYQLKYKSYKTKTMTMYAANLSICSDHEVINVSVQKVQIADTRSPYSVAVAPINC